MDQPTGHQDVNNQDWDQPDQIRKYFNPIQPSVKTKDGIIAYEERMPTPGLRNHIHCYWKLNTQQRLASPFNYRVVSDGCIDVFFNLTNTAESFVMGFSHTYTEFSIGNEFSYGGIRFYPSIFPMLFGISAKQLADQDQALHLTLPDFANFISHNITADFFETTPHLDTFLHALIKTKKPKPDDRFFKAFLTILKKKGNLETEKELATGLSPRQLRRYFNHYIGTSPKALCQVVRFQHILNAKQPADSQEDHKLYFDVGFYDQAHFIKTFTKFYGVTPSKAFG